ncbi:MAG: hypothetical protein DI539_22490, partial [Flavobacterium psychrophilum]
GGNDVGDITGLILNLTADLGGTFKMMTEGIQDAKKIGMPSSLGLFGGTEPSVGENYNCWGTCIALNDGRALQGKGPKDKSGVGIGEGYMFEDELRKDYVSVTLDEAVIGQTVLRYAERKTNSSRNGHGAVYMGKDMSGNQYVFSKNGWHVAPDVFLKSYVDGIYGLPEWRRDRYGRSVMIFNGNEVSGMYPGESGYYQKKR